MAVVAAAFGGVVARRVVMGGGAAPDTIKCSTHVLTLTGKHFRRGYRSLVGTLAYWRLSWSRGLVGKQGVSAAAISFLVSVSIVMFVLVGGEGPRQAEVTVFDEVPETNEFTAAGPEPDRPVWLTDYNTHVPLIGVLTSSFYDDLEAVEQAERDALVDSLSPGVRANYEGARPERAAARKREHEREEVEYAAFIEERMRRLTTTVRATP